MKFHITLLDILSSKTRIKIISFLLNHRASMSEREIASVLKISHMSVNRTMKELADINFVDFITVGKAHLWKVNRKSYAFKTLSNLIKGSAIGKSPKGDLTNDILRNIPKSLAKRIILFGSVANGSEKIDSDIDIFILVADKKCKEKLEPILEKLSNVCFETYGNRLSPYVLTEKEAKQKKKSKFVQEIEKGIEIFPKTKE